MYRKEWIGFWCDDSTATTMSKWPNPKDTINMVSV